MNEWVEYSAKTVDEAITKALLNLQTTSDKVEYEVIEKETNGILGLFAKPAKIRVRLKKKSIQNVVDSFLTDIFEAMNLTASFQIDYNEAEGTLNVDITGEDMGLLIGKRGQTLDSLQYLTSLVVNKESESYLKVKVDTENYRQRRRDTLENLAHNIALKVKKTRRPVSLEPMNSFERRIIHSALQNDKYVETHSEGEEPYRKVVVTLKRNVKEYNSGNRAYHKKPYKRDYQRSEYKNEGN